MNKVYSYQSLVLKELKAICKFSRLLNIGVIKLRKLNLQTCIPWEPWCFYATPTHLLKLRFSYTENRNVQACEGALEGFIFESSFASRDHEVPHDLLFCLRYMFQRFRIISSIEFRLAND